MMQCHSCAVHLAARVYYASFRRYGIGCCNSLVCVLCTREPAMCAVSTQNVTYELWS